jgi:hypothetical protein
MKLRGNTIQKRLTANCDSAKPLRHNLNVVYSIRKQSHNTVSKKLIDNVDILDKTHIINSFNDFFSTIGEKAG